MAARGHFYCCPWQDCEKRFECLKIMLQHLFLKHSSNERCDLLCGISACNQIYTTADSYRKHVKRNHQDAFEFDKTHCETLGLAEIGQTVSEGTSDMIDLAQDGALEFDDDDMECDGDIDVQGSERVNEQNFLQTFTKRVLLFSLKARERYVLPKATFGALMNDISQLVSVSHNEFCEQVVVALNKQGIATSSAHDLNKILKEDHLFLSAWESMNTESKFNKMCRNNLNLVEPIQVLFTDDTPDNVSQKKFSFQYIPIIETLKTYIAHEDVLFSIMQECEKYATRDEEIMHDYSDGDIFHTHPFFSSHPRALRLHFYIDDFELCNPLGSAKTKHKITGIYFFVGNVEKRYLSALTHIHVAVLAPALLNKKTGGLAKIVNNLLVDLQTLESEGFVISCKGKQYHFFASMATISGDNLAIHEIGGFRRTFSSGRMCRVCMVPYAKVRTFVSETDQNFPILRSKDVHKSHVSAVLCDRSLSSVYGVNGDNIFSTLPTFEVTTSLPPDLMHDILEGVIPVTLSLVFRCLIIQKLISVSVLNDRLKSFKFSGKDKTNKPPMFKDNLLKCGVHGTASEMWALFDIVPFLIGDLVPVEEDGWRVYLLLREICDIILSPSVRKEWIPVLDQLISDHHTLFLTLSSGDFTPKFHFLVHYPRLLMQYGPLRNLWCMRFEGYHRYLKNICKRTGNFINICKTLAERNQLRKCWEMSGENILISNKEVSKQSDVSISWFPVAIQAKLLNFFGCDQHARLTVAASLHHCNVMYAVNDFIVIDVLHEDVPLFMKLKHIVGFEGVWCLVGEMYISVRYINHFHSYIVENAEQLVFIRPGQELDHTAVNGYEILFEGQVQMFLSLRYRIAARREKSLKV